MSERLGKILATVHELESELASLDSIDSETRSALEGVLGEIGDALRRTDAESLAHQQSLIQRLQESAVGFESSHPNLFGIVERTVNALGQMGI